MRTSRNQRGWPLLGKRALSGQMAVELAVLMPVIIVVALVVYNLGRFVAVSASFDRVALDAVVSQGVSPAGVQTNVNAVEAVRTCLEDALALPDSCSVEVELQRTQDGATGRGLTLAPLLSTYKCVLVYRPWPSSFVIAGVRYEAPLVLRHERSLVVDRFRPGVVM